MLPHVVMVGMWAWHCRLNGGEGVRDLEREITRYGWPSIITLDWVFMVVCFLKITERETGTRASLCGIAGEMAAISRPD